MQIKTTMKYHHTFTRMTTTKKSTIMLERVWKKGNPPTLLVGMQIGPAIMETNMEVVEKLEFPYDPAIQLLGKRPHKTTLRKDTCIPIFTAALFTIAKTWKQP